jgi:acetyltransferase-like isoleucine patch superfamily enzyme
MSSTSSEEVGRGVRFGAEDARRWLQRFLVPRFVVSLYYFVRYRAFISTRAEVELSAFVTLGKGCTIGSFTKIKATKGPLTVGCQSGFANGCFVSSAQGGIHIGENFICGPNVNIVGSNYVFEELGRPLEAQGHTSRGIRIGNNVWVGAGTTILDGSVIGDNSIVVAASLVNRRFPANSIIQGNPAKVIMKLTRPP